MDIKIKKINDEKVKPIITKKVDPKNIKGYKLFAEPFANIFLCAKKKSGKTCTVFKILKDCATKDTTIISFVSTLNNDATWVEIKNHFDKKGIPFIGYTSMDDEETGENHLENLIKTLKDEAKEREEKKRIREAKKNGEYLSEAKKEQKPTSFIITNEDLEEEEEEEEEEEKKSKVIAPEYIIVLDDLSTELKSPLLTKLLKENRHFKTKVIISSQYYKDMLPASRLNIDYYILFKGIPTKLLEIIWKDSNLNITFPVFYRMYNKATEKPYSFFYIGKTDCDYRINFNEKFEL